MEHVHEFLVANGVINLEGANLSGCSSKEEISKRCMAVRAAVKSSSETLSVFERYVKKVDPMSDIPLLHTMLSITFKLTLLNSNSKSQL